MLDDLRHLPPRDSFQVIEEGAACVAFVVLLLIAAIVRPW